MLLAYLGFLLLLGRASSSDVVYQPLDSSGGSGVWRFLYPNTSTWYPSNVPGQVHLDLLRTGLIEEPYSELNVDEYSWIKHTPWSLTCAFTPTPALLAKRRVVMVFEGIDTVSNVSLNGKALFSTSSAFIQYSVDVTDALAAAGGGPQEVRVDIASPTDFAAEAAAACTGFCPSPKWGPASNLSSYDQATTYLNKPLVHGGWDFAPNFAPSGVWKSVYLVGVDSVEVEEVGVVTTPATLPVPLSPSSSTTVPWTLNVTAHCRVPSNPTSPSPFSVRVEVTVLGLPPGSPSSASTLTQLTPSGLGGTQPVVVSLTIPSGVTPWWPHGLGLPTLYNVSVTVTSVGDGEVSVRDFKVGFRTVALSQPPSPSPTGGSLYVFSVNGHALFIKGANWVPPDAFPARASATSHVTPRLTSFVQAGYNTLRVWGGGYPASTEFYEVAQALGLLVWQEMPYACMLSPTGVIHSAGGIGGGGTSSAPPPTYLSNAHLATLFTVQRLQKFSILLWGGNNEVAQIGNFSAPSTASNYSALFFGAIGATVGSLDPSRRFVPSSPGSGTETPAAPIPSPPVSYFSGDVHYYNYASNCWDPRQYPRPRAASEFGWQSYSSLPSLAELVGPAGWDYWSPPIQRRDTHAGQPPATILLHNVGNNWRIPGYNGTSPFSQPQDRDGRLRGRAADLAAGARAAGSVTQNYTRRGDGTFALPTDALSITGVMMGSYGGVGAHAGTVFRDTLLLTQLSQAQCVKTEAEKYRRLQSDCMGQGGGGGEVDSGGGCTAVLLYWMSADLWPGATKGSIEWSGRWKALHYEAAERFLAPLLLSPWVFRDWEGGGLDSAPLGVTLAAHAPASLHTPIPNGTLRTQCWSWAGGLLGASYSSVAVASWGNVSSAWAEAGDVSASGGSVALELEGGGVNATLGGVLASCGCPSPTYTPSECVLTFDLFEGQAGENWTSSPLASNYLLPTPLNTVSTMQVPQLAITDVEDNREWGGPGSFNVTLTAVGLPVAFVWIESLLCCGHFSTNGFLMTISPMIVTYYPGEDARGWAWAARDAAAAGKGGDGISPGQFAASLSIWSLAETAGGLRAATVGGVRKPSRDIWTMDPVRPSRPGSPSTPYPPLHLPSILMRSTLLLLSLLSASDALSWTSTACPVHDKVAADCSQPSFSVDSAITIFFQVESKDPAGFACKDTTSPNITYCARNWGNADESGAAGSCWFLLPQGRSYTCTAHGSVNIIDSSYAPLAKSVLAAPSPLACPSGSLDASSSSSSSCTQPGLAADAWVVASYKGVGDGASSFACLAGGLTLCSFTTALSGPGDQSSCSFLLAANTPMVCAASKGTIAFDAPASSTPFTIPYATDDTPMPACPRAGPKPNDCDCSADTSGNTTDSFVTVTSTTPDGGFNSFHCYTEGVNVCGWGSNVGMNGTSATCAFILAAGSSYDCSMEWGAATFTASAITSTKASLFSAASTPALAQKAGGKGGVTGVTPPTLLSFSTSSASVTRLEGLWVAWKAEHGVAYSTGAEEGMRYGNFQRHVAMADQASKSTKGVPHLDPITRLPTRFNRFADMSLEEWEVAHPRRVSTVRVPERTELGGADPPPPPPPAPLPSFDWRSKGVLTPVKDQGQCGSCWTFSTTEVVESAWAIAGNNLTSLSEQELVSCAYSAGDGCDGGFPNEAVLWVAKNGLDTEASYPYVSGDGNTRTCNQSNAVKSDVNVTGYWVVPGNTSLAKEEEMINWLAAYGPLSILVDDMPQLWWVYHGGVMSGCCDVATDHAVLLVGYGESAEEGKWWVIRNSWGTSWGEEGYLRLKRGDNECGIGYFPMVPTVKGGVLPPPPPPPPPRPVWECPPDAQSVNTSSTASCIWTNATSKGVWTMPPVVGPYCTYFSQGYMGYTYDTTSYKAADYPCPPSFVTGTNAPSGDDIFCTLTKGEKGVTGFPVGAVANCDELSKGVIGYSWPVQ